MKQMLLVLSLVIGLSAIAQNKKAYQNSFDSVDLFLKVNYAGYEEKVNSKTSTEYRQQLKKCKSDLLLAANDGQAQQVLKNSLLFFKDRHLTIQFPSDTANGKLAAAIKSTETVSVSGNTISGLRKAAASSIEGIYTTADSTYEVALVKNKKGLREYAGVIVSSKAKEWTPGQLKFELLPVGNGAYDIIFYNRYHFPVFARVTMQPENNLATQGWFKITTDARPVQNIPKYIPPFEEENTFVSFFKKVDEQTAYIRISSFDADYIKLIDSVVTTNLSTIESIPYLIIDIRGNGGGADIAYRPLKKLMYTDPVKSIGVDFLATPYNIQATRSLINSIAGFPAEDKKEYFDLLDKAAAGNSKWFDIYPDRTDTMQGVATPKKIAVIMNKRCASTAEQFLLEARQSKKVKLYGTYSSGVLDYANVRDKDFAAGFSVHYPSTRSRRVNIGQGIDNEGIKPDVVLNFDEQNWLQKVVAALKTSD